MPDIAGAMAAIESWLDGNWSTTPIAKVNTPPSAAVTNAQNQGSPWSLIEITNTLSNPRAAGKPGDQFWLYEGLIHVHVYVKLNQGITDARNYASQIGELFRNKTFYNSTPGYQVRTLSPKIDDGDIGSDDGTWFRVTCTVNFEYYHRG